MSGGKKGCNDSEYVDPAGGADIAGGVNTDGGIHLCSSAAVGLFRGVGPGPVRPAAIVSGGAVQF